MIVGLRESTQIGIAVIRGQFQNQGKYRLECGIRKLVGKVGDGDGTATHSRRNEAVAIKRQSVFGSDQN